MTKRDSRDSRIFKLWPNVRRMPVVTRPVLEPCLKHEYGPKAISALTAAGEMVRPQLANRLRTKMTFASEPSFVQKVFSPISKRPAQPCTDGNAEPHLRVFASSLGNVTT